MTVCDTYSAKKHVGGRFNHWVIFFTPTFCNSVRTFFSKWPKSQKIDTCYVTFSLSFVWYESNRKKMLKEYFEFNAQELSENKKLYFLVPLAFVVWTRVQCPHVVCIITFILVPKVIWVEHRLITHFGLRMLILNTVRDSF